MKDSFNFSTGGITSKLSKKQKLIIASVSVALAVVLAVLFARACSSSGARKERSNTIELVKMYMERGEYDRALDKIDSLLVKDKKDKDALEILNQILAARNASGNSGENSSSGNGTSLSPQNLRVEVDTEGLTEAMRDSIASMRDEIAKNSQATEDFLRQQQEQSRQQIAKQKAEEERRVAEAAEKEAEQKALEERRKAEEARRKAEEEALARKNAQLKREIASVNDEIEQAKTSLNSGNVGDALKHFSNAEEKLPVSGGEPAFSASKYSEMAALMKDASEKSGSDAERKTLKDKAVEYAEKAVAKEPGNPEANFILGQNEMEKRNYQKAIDYFSAAIRGNSSNYEYYYNIGRAQYMARKYTEAKASFSTASQLNPKFAPARYNLGLSNLRLNDKKSAKEAFIRAREIDSRYEKAYLEEARVLVQLGEYQNAISAYQNVVSLNNVNRSALQELGSVYVQTKNYPLAEESFRKSLALLPSGQDDPLTCYNLSTVLFESGKINDAVLYAKKAYDTKDSVKDAGAKVNIIYNYALLCDASGNSSEAISKYAEVLSLNPDHLKTQINLGVMYMNLDPPDTDTALSLFTKAYSKNPENFEANNNLGSAYLARKDYPNAVKYFQKALVLDSKNNDVRFNLGKAFASDQQFDNAKTTYMELLRLDSNYWDGYIELGKVCMALSDNSSAEKYLIFVEEKNPGYRKQEIDSLLSQIKSSS